MGFGTASVSPREYCLARRLRGIAVAGFAALARAGRMAGCGALGASSGAGRIGGMDHRNEEYRIGFVLPAIDPFLCKIFNCKRAQGPKARGWNYALSLLFAALAMASKSSAVILPGVVCLCAWWVEGGWRWRRAARVVPMFLMSAAASALSLWTEGLRLATATDPQWVRTWPQRLAAAGDAVWFYLGKLLWP